MMEKYTNEYILKNGDTLLIVYFQSITLGGWDYPDEVEQSDTQFFIEGKEVAVNKLPPEITQAIIYDLERNANEDRTYTSDGPDFDPDDVEWEEGDRDAESRSIE